MTIDLTARKTAFVRMGWDEKGEKHPQFLEHWTGATVKTEEEIAAHFKKYQDAGIAILTGKEAGITVIDFDSKDNPLFQELFQACPTYWVATKKGFHLYYRYIPDLRQGTNRLGKGVDIRNDGGVVFAPPTKNYVGSEDAIEAINDAAKAILNAHYTPGSGKAPSDKELAATETRNDSLFRKACGWINVYDQQEVWNRMVKANKAFKKGELTDEELEQLFQQVIGYAPKKDPNAVPIEMLDLLYTENAGKKTYNVVTENVFRILNHHPEFAGRFRFDEWTQKAELKNALGWRELEDKDIIPIQRRISTLYAQFRAIRKDMVTDAIMDVCHANTFDRAVDWIRSLTWDNTVRLEGWLSEVYGVENSSYHNAVGANWLKGMAKRLIEPGCQFDSVLILKGKQGCGKSSSLMLLGQDWYTETTMRADNKDFFLNLRGKMIVEFAEGETLSKTETKQMKAIISARVDTYRAPYGRMTKDYPRRCVFSMTTNQERPLKDDTGNRRFFPVEVVAERANLDWLKENRDQLFAEALYRVETLKESVHEYPATVAEIQEQSVEESPYESDILRWRNEGCQGINNMDVVGATISDVWRYALDGDRNRLDMRITVNISQGLKACGFAKKKIMIGGERRWRWFPKIPIGAILTNDRHLGHLGQSESLDTKSLDTLDTLDTGFNGSK